MAGKIDALVKLSIVASVWLASSSVGYYYLVYLPRRDAQIDVERSVERARADAEKRAEQERLLEKRASEQRAVEQRQAAEKIAAQNRYQTCLSQATESHQASWAAECKRLGRTAAEREKTLKEHADCISNKGQM